MLESHTDAGLNRRITVLADGTVTLPLLGQVPAADHTLTKLNAQLNDNLYQASDAARYATLFFGFYDPRERSLRYSNAGHHPPVLLRGREVSRLDERGLPIGLFAAAEYSEGRTRLRPGDLLALFTDGVSETPDANGEEFGEERLIALLLRHRELDLREIVTAVLGELESWSNGAEPHDDVTLVLARAQ